MDVLNDNMGGNKMLHLKTFEKKYDGTNINQYNSDEKELRKDLFELGHLVDSCIFRTRFILADYNPIAMVYFYSSKISYLFRESEGEISFQIRHFFEEDKRFPELEELAEKYGLNEVNQNEH